jgi:hypothetical protein
MATYPIATSPSQIVLSEDFIPYRAGDYTVSQTNGTAASFGFPGGMLKLSTTGSTAADVISLQRLGAAFQALPLNQIWCNTKLAYPASVGNANDTNIYAGLFDNAVPSSASNGIYFIKPAGGTAVHFVIKKAGTTTTFQNIADLVRPSGLYGDTNSIAGTLSATVAGNVFTAVTIATPGAGYQSSPLVLSTSTSGSAGNVPVMVGIGSTANSQSNPAVPIVTSGLAYGSLYAPFVSVPGSGYTNAGPVTTYLEVEPLIDLAFYYNGKDTLYVGVNGRQVLSIGASGVVGVAAGATVNVATGISPAYLSATQLTTSVAPVQPSIGSAFNLLPLLPLTYGVSVANTTANARALYLNEYSVGVELN